MTLNARVICWSAAAVLSLAGLGLATYLSVIHLSGADLACGVSGGCGAVTTSEYSRFLGMPVALLGVGGYACCCWVALRRLAFRSRRRCCAGGWRALLLRALRFPRI